MMKRLWLFRLHNQFAMTIGSLAQPLARSETQPPHMTHACQGTAAANPSAWTVMLAPSAVVETHHRPCGQRQPAGGSASPTPILGRTLFAASLLFLVGWAGAQAHEFTYDAADPQIPAILSDASPGREPAAAPGHARADSASVRDNPRPSVGDWSDSRTTCRPVPLRSVKLGGFLGSHVDANNRKSLRAGLKSPIPGAIEARERGVEPPDACRRLATDSDFYKWLEAACYAISYDDSLQDIAAAVDRYAETLVRLQDKDGYLGTRLSPAKPFDERVHHDLYVAGHFIEAAVAHYKATGKRTLLDAACRFADFYIRAMESGHPYFQTVGAKEHPEIELAAVRLYRATGEKRYLDFSAAITRTARVGPSLAEVQAGGGSRHAVRLCYLLAGSAELYMEGRDAAFVRPLGPLWDEIVSTRMYITGGIGYIEGIPLAPYDLPQCLVGDANRDIAETCASVAIMMFSWRMHALRGQSRYFDVIENILYNHYLGAISPDHLGNFYYNPLRRVGDMTGRTDHGGDPVRRTRLPKIHSTTCCMPNAWRFFAELPEYVFSVGNNGLFVNLYTDAMAEHRLGDGTRVAIEMKTRYPHEGDVSLRIRPEKPVRFGLALRIPGWCETATARVVDGPSVAAVPGEYHRINREWHAGDEVTLTLRMKPRVIMSRPEITANAGQVAFRRGPLVYCLEKQDAPGIDLERAVVVLDREQPSRSVTAEFCEDLEMNVLKVRAFERQLPATRPAAYYPATAFRSPNVQEATLIPFFYRANRAEDTRWITFIPYE